MHILTEIYREIACAHSLVSILLIYPLALGIGAAICYGWVYAIEWIFYKYNKWKHPEEYCTRCGIYPADLPSDLCVGCESYMEHENLY